MSLHFKLIRMKFFWGILILLFINVNILWGQKNTPGEKYALLGEEFKKNMMPDSAVYYYKKAALEFKAKGETETLIVTYHQIGTLLTRQDKFEEARMYFGKADLEGMTMPDTNSLLRASTFSGIGVIYSSVGDFQGALFNHQRALGIRLMKSGERNADVATSYGQIGNVYLNLNEYDKAIEAHLKAKEIREKVFGAKSVETTLSYTNLGIAYKENKDYATSLEYFQKALQNKMAQPGSENKDLAKLYTSISGVYDLLGNKEQAAIYKSKADEILKK